MEPAVWMFILAGFIAQVIDGALGMGYGVTCATFLLTLGIPPAPVSASVHTAEIFTSGVSGLFHLRFGNVDKNLFKSLFLPGMMGGILGAYILSALPGEKIKPFIAFYLLLMGLRILYKTFQKEQKAEAKTIPFPAGLGFFGGFFDAIGGGGWGPIVTSTLVAGGNHPRFAIGSANLAEFFVTLAESATFIITVRLAHWKVIAGLILGGIIAAPLAAYSAKTLPSRLLTVLVSALIITLSIRTLLLALS